MNIEGVSFVLIWLVSNSHSFSYWCLYRNTTLLLYVCCLIFDKLIWSGFDSFFDIYLSVNRDTKSKRWINVIYELCLCFGFVWVISGTCLSSRENGNCFIEFKKAISFLESKFACKRPFADHEWKVIIYLSYFRLCIRKYCSVDKCVELRPLK